MAAKAKKAEPLSQEKIIAQFQQLRQEQATIANKMADLEGERNEHQLVDLTLTLLEVFRSRPSPAPPLPGW